MACITCKSVDLLKDSPFFCGKCKEYQSNSGPSVVQTLLLNGPETALLKVYRKFRKQQSFMPSDLVLQENAKPSKVDERWSSSITQATSQNCDAIFHEMDRLGIEYQECIEGTE